MKKFLEILFLFVLLSLFLNHGILIGQSKKILKEAQECSSEVLAKKLIAKYKKLNDPYKQLYQGIVFHNLSANGYIKYIQKAIENTKTAYDKTKYPLALGYLGSTITLQANQYYEKNDLMSALTKLDEGIKMIDKAVEEGKEDIDLRFLRINHSVGISAASPINRYDKVKEDLDFFKSKYKTLSNELKSMFHFYSGLIAKKENNYKAALSSFKKAIQCSPRSYYAISAKKSIKELEK